MRIKPVAILFKEHRERRIDHGAIIFSQGVSQHYDGLVLVIVRFLHLPSRKLDVVKGREFDRQLTPLGAFLDLLSISGHQKVLDVEAGTLDRLVEHH